MKYQLIHIPDSDEQAIIEELKDHDEVMVVDRFFNREETLTLHHAVSSEADKIRGQLIMLLEDKELPKRFLSFLVKYDDEKIIEKVWGILTYTQFPDTFGFKLL